MAGLRPLFVDSGHGYPTSESFERLRADLSTTFINLPDDEIERDIARALGRIAGCFALEQVTLYELSDSRTKLTPTAGARDGASPSPDIVKADDPVRWTMLLDCSGVIAASDPDDSQDVWAASVPLRVGGKSIGALRVAGTTRDVSWTGDLAAQLTALAEVLSGAVMRKRMARALLDRTSALRQARTEARKSERRFRLAADTAPVMIWMSDTTRLCTYFNKPWLDFVGRPMSAELGSGWAEGVHPDDLSACMATYARAFDRREPFTMQYRLRRHDGEYRWVLDSGVPRFDQQGWFFGYIGSCFDVTAVKLAEEALSTLGGRLMEAQEQERRRIARQLHDDVCQRLTALAIELHQLNRDYTQAGIQARSEELFNRTVNIASDVQALSHELHSSKLEYLGIVAAIKGFCEEFAQTQQDTTIDFTFGGVPTHLPGDVSLCLFRVLQEGLRNALKHSGVRHVEVRLTGTPGAVMLTIMDGGRGFEPEAAMNGPGLGLISMRERASLVKGTIRVMSKPGSGTQISMRIPIDAGHERRRVTTGASTQVYRIPADRV